MKVILASLIIALTLSAVGHSDNIEVAHKAVLNVAEVDGYLVSRRLASVRIGANGGCSGTMIAIIDWSGKECALGISASHCGYRVNDVFGVGFVDGERATARCIDVDSDVDLMAFVVDAKRVPGIAPVAQGSDRGECFAVGFPSTVGPIEKRIEYRKTWTMTEADTGERFERNQWYVRDGHHSSGDSGGGIFAGEFCIGVLTHGDPSNKSGNDLTIQAATHPQVASFLKRNRKIRQRECTDGTCTDEGPRDLWWLKPNVDIAVPGRPVRNPELIEDESRRDINRDREQKKAIAELQSIVKQLTVRVEQLEQRSDSIEVNPDEPPPPPIGGDDHPPSPLIGERGLKGDRGEPGPQGPPGPARTIEVVFKWPNGATEKAEVPPSKARVIYTFKTETTERSAVADR